MMMMMLKLMMLTMRRIMHKFDDDDYGEDDDDDMNWLISKGWDTPMQESSFDDDQPQWPIYDQPGGKASIW